MSMNLAYTVFRPETEVKAALFVIHGMQEHKERYTPFAKYLNEQGIGVVTYDLPGHGETSKGSERGWFGDHDGWNNLVLSAVEIAQLTRKEFPDVPLVCFGHSMGTMIGRCFLQRYDSLIDAAIFSGAPAYVGAARAGVALANAISAIRGKKGHSKTLDKLATGSFSKAVKNPRTPLDWLSVNTENVDRYIADPDCGFPFTCRGYHDLFAGMVQMNNVSLYRCTKPELPVYFFAGEQDPCIGGEKGFTSSVETIRKAGYSRIDTKLYPGLRHETLNEKENAAVMADVSAWIFAHI